MITSSSSNFVRSTVNSSDPLVTGSWVAIPAEAEAEDVDTEASTERAPDLSRWLCPEASTASFDAAS